MAAVHSSAVGLSGVVVGKQARAYGRKGFMSVLVARRARRRWRRNARSRRDEGKEVAMMREDGTRVVERCRAFGRRSFLFLVSALLMERVKAVRVQHSVI